MSGSKWIIRFYKTPLLIRKFRNSLIWSKNSDNEIFITFDDGPHPQITPWILKSLEEHDARATFFCLGKNLNKYEELAGRIVAKGHLIANHTYDHEKGTITRNAEYLQSIQKCEAEIVRIQKYSKHFFRPPYGRIKKSQIRDLSMNHKIVMWSHLAWDFDGRSDDEKSLRILKNAKPGSIIVFHDNVKSEEKLKKLLPQLLKHWSSKNMKYSTL